MEPTTRKEKAQKGYVVDLTQSLSADELARLEAEAKETGKSLKAYALSLLFTKHGESAERPARDYQGGGGR